MKTNKLWFNNLDAHSLCRGGGNGPLHPSQLDAIKKYVTPGSKLLDFGCGSGTTYEALKKENMVGALKWIQYYLGLDIIAKNIEFCKETFPEAEFSLNENIHEISQPSKTWDVVYSRHVVDHMDSFEKAMDEHKRVALDLVIVVLWVKLSDASEHQIHNITENGKTYPDEYTNTYSRAKVKDYLIADPNWELIEFLEGVGKEVQGYNTNIVLRRKRERA